MYIGMTAGEIIVQIKVKFHSPFDRYGFNSSWFIMDDGILAGNTTVDWDSCGIVFQHSPVTDIMPYCSFCIQVSGAINIADYKVYPYGRISPWTNFGDDAYCVFPDGYVGNGLGGVGDVDWRSCG